MEQTIRELKGEQIQKEVKPEIHLGVSAYIPEEYMSDVRRRLITYKRLSLAANEEELASIKAELIDCYGFAPPEVVNLTEVIAIRNLLSSLQGKKITYDGGNIIISFHQESNVDPVKILGLAKSRWPGLRLTPSFQLHVHVPGLKGEKVLWEAKNVLQELVS
jgi:transcription-repair coupling factor (superfamily II helicase)